MRTLTIVNVVLAGLALVLWRRAAGRTDTTMPRGMPWPAVVLLGGLVLLLNLARPLEAADPYHLERVAQIERLGTLEYDLAADPKVNVLGWVYEMLLADLRQIAMIGPALVRLHGLLGLVLYVLAVRVVREWLTGGPRWAWGSLFAVPVVFHQLVLVKNDLFGAVPALVAIAWLVMRSGVAPWREIAWVSWLVGFAVGVKLTSFPLALVAFGVVIARQREGWRPLGALVAGGAVGAVAGGVLFTLAANARWYGDAIEPLAALGNRTSGPADAIAGVARFAISLIDLGVITRRWWPGRGGWGGTFGLPLIWALAVLGAQSRSVPEARRALWIASAYFVMFAAVYPDADIAHRLALAPGLLLIGVAVDLVDKGDRPSPWLRRSLVPVVILSSAQIVRSGMLYLALVGGR
jgi:hypothetical protein